MSNGGWSSSWKGRCSKCRWSFYKSERYCTYCGGWVRYPTHHNREERGAPPNQGRIPPTLPLPSKQQQNAAALQQQPQTANGGAAWVTPRGTPKAGSGRASSKAQQGDNQTSTQPGDLEKIYKFSASVLGEHHKETARAKEAWKTAEKACLKKNPPTLEKQVHTAKEKIGRMQRKVNKAKDHITEREQDLEEAKQAAQAAQERLELAKQNEQQANADLSQAQLDYAAVIAKLQAQPGAPSTAGSLLAMVGIPQGQDVPTDIQDTLNQIQALMQTVADTVKQRQQPPPTGEGEQAGQDAQPPRPPAPEDPAGSEAPAEPPTGQEPARMDTDTGSSPANAEEPSAKTLKRDIRGTPTRGSCP